MKVTFFTREYPPHVYGGAGVHIKNLSAHLARSIDVDVRCIGDQWSLDDRLGVKGYQAWERMWEGNEPKFNSVLGTFACNLSMVRDAIDADVIHSHTWYGAMAGYMGKLLYGKPYVVTVHSLEPMRPWKEEQLGRSYHLTSWIEKVAIENADRVVAVSQHSREEILQYFDIDPQRVVVIHNGIDLQRWRPLHTDETRRAFEIDKDYILFRKA
jgi:starch synthase